MQHPILKDAKDALDKLSADPVALEAAERRESELWFYEYGKVLEREQALAEGKEQGRAEGKEQGRAEGKRQALQRLLILKFHELPAEHQTRLATSTEADLDRWLDRLVTAPALDAVFAG